jgi:hypothetical protein
VGRRNFLKASTLTAGATLLPNVLDAGAHGTRPSHGADESWLALQPESC